MFFLFLVSLSKELDLYPTVDVPILDDSLDAIQQLTQEISYLRQEISYLRTLIEETRLYSQYVTPSSNFRTHDDFYSSVISQRPTTDIFDPLSIPTPPNRTHIVFSNHPQYRFLNKTHSFNVSTRFPPKFFDTLYRPQKHSVTTPTPQRGVDIYNHKHHDSHSDSEYSEDSSASDYETSQPIEIQPEDPIKGSHDDPSLSAGFRPEEHKDPY